MIRRLSFNPSIEEHRLFYELAHVLVVTDSEKRSRTEEDRLVDLQDEWESHGHRVGDEKVAGTGDFIAHRHRIDRDDEPFDLYVEDATFELLKKIVTDAPVMGHVRRYRRPLIAFVEAAEKGKLVEGVFTTGATKKEDRALPRSKRKNEEASE